MTNSGIAAAVIVAAGKSTRMSVESMQTSVDKINSEIGGVPCVVYALLAFEKADSIGQTVAVTRRESIKEFEGYKEKYGLKKLSVITEGGVCRQHSAALGFSAVAEEYSVVAVHDGARPLITPSEIDSVVLAAKSFGAAISASAVKDTIKLVGADEYVIKTLDRRFLISVATPQAFKREIYEEMVCRFRDNYASFTDDAGMAEALGYKVKIVPCSYKNIKITTPEDIYVAEKLMETNNEQF